MTDDSLWSQLFKVMLRPQRVKISLKVLIAFTFYIPTSLRIVCCHILSHCRGRLDTWCVLIQSFPNTEVGQAPGTWVRVGFDPDSTPFSVNLAKSLFPGCFLICQNVHTTTCPLSSRCCVRAKQTAKAQCFVNVKTEVIFFYHKPSSSSVNNYLLFHSSGSDKEVCFACFVLFLDCSFIFQDWRVLYDFNFFSWFGTSFSCPS